MNNLYPQTPEEHEALAAQYRAEAERKKGFPLFAQQCADYLREAEALEATAKRLREASSEPEPNVSEIPAGQPPELVRRWLELIEGVADGKPRPIPEDFETRR